MARKLTALEARAFFTRGGTLSREVPIPVGQGQWKEIYEMAFGYPPKGGRFSGLVMSYSQEGLKVESPPEWL